MRTWPWIGWVSIAVARQLRNDPIEPAAARSMSCDRSGAGAPPYGSSGASAPPLPVFLVSAAAWRLGSLGSRGAVRIARGRGRVLARLGGAARRRGGLGRRGSRRSRCGRCDRDRCRGGRGGLALLCRLCVGPRLVEPLDQHQRARAREPEIGDDHEGDPRAAAPRCGGHRQRRARHRDGRRCRGAALRGWGSPAPGSSAGCCRARGWGGMLPYEQRAGRRRRQVTDRVERAGRRGRNARRHRCRGPHRRHVVAAGGAYGVSSGTLSVGATRDGSRRAPQPPQNRESGAFSVPQLGQRIPIAS